jgi:cellulose synthase/poly-beta-1,6-N-acetylglucosamine synthase-like glycosyltransferase
VLTTTFWLLAGLTAYVYFGYPLLLKLVHKARPRGVATGSIEPRVSLIVSAYNEEATIGAKLENSLALDYPPDKIEVLVVSDASTDGTDAAVQRFADRGVRLIRMAERGGKTLGLNEGVKHAHGEIVVFSDANAMYRRDAIRRLVENFHDATVGAVVGESTYSDSETASEASESLYWRYETGIKRLESETGSVVGGDGAIYAIRRSLYAPMRADALSDFVNPMQIVKAGFRCVYAPGAQSVEKAAENFEKEFRRKVRIVNRAWRATLSLPELLNPMRYGFFSIKLISHKLLRWLVPLFLSLLLVINVLLAERGGIYLLALASQLVFYGLAAVGHALRHRPRMPRLIQVPYYFVMVNVASARGIMDALRGETYTTWATARDPGVTRG